MLHAFYKISHFRSPLKFHLAGIFHHFIVQILKNRLVVSVQKCYGFLDIVRVCLLGDISLARRLALVYLIIKAWTLQTYISWKLPVAGSYIIYFPEQFNGILNSPAVGVGTKILGVVTLHLMGIKDPWEILIYSYLDVRISLIICKHGVVVGAVLLYEITLKHQRLDLGATDYILEPGDMTDHFLDLR